MGKSSPILAMLVAEKLINHWEKGRKTVERPLMKDIPLMNSGDLIGILNKRDTRHACRAVRVSPNSLVHDGIGACSHTWISCHPGLVRTYHLPLITICRSQFCALPDVASTGWNWSFPILGIWWFRVGCTILYTTTIMVMLEIDLKISHWMRKLAHYL